jgi:hypothetical protein
MKNITLPLLLAFVVFSLTANSQEQDTLFMSKLMDKEWTKEFSLQTQFRVIKFEDGSSLTIGEKMKIGIPSGTNQSNSTAVGLFGSSTSRVNNFTYLLLGKPGMAMMSGAIYLSESSKGKEEIIEDIRLYRSKKESKPHTAVIIFNNPGIESAVTVLDVAFALQFGEIINPKAAMTSDQALAELKKAKDKLDLGLISQQQFDSLKVILSKIIK